MNFKIIVEIYIGKTRPDFSKTPVFRPRPLSRWIIHTNDFEVNVYGSIWGENLVLNLGNHMSVYRQPRSSLWWQLNQTMSPINPHFQPQSVKVSASSITGNFGEVLTILALESRINLPRFMNICHLTSRYGGKSPDLFLESNPLLNTYQRKFQIKNTLVRPNLPDFMPGECKNNDFLKALKQIAVYWFNNQTSPDYGFGLVSSINFRQSNEIYLSFNLLIPRDIPKLRSQLTSETIANAVKQEHFRETHYGFKS
ncbi:hypothetical protein [Paenibacillus sp. ATY16]|uniref:hypothetical protein n=1 Tax=Paenibacillus sp. ATY16 TaxID=1759312 RepID=UPI0013C2F34D|nr:hypothetical protein [Paenibacillus sp. ATY16]MCK9857603.1 hypothetical protein [Paenibacillus sp. ATY16]